MFTESRFTNRIIHLNIPMAVATVMDMAVKQERIGNKESANTWLVLAERIERGQFLSIPQVDRLVKDYPFLKECRQ
jgi:hypothetical protein